MGLLDYIIDTFEIGSLIAATSMLLLGHQYYCSLLIFRPTLKLPCF